MSGRLYVPPALEGKNIITDPEALKLQIRYVKGFVKEFKNEKQIVAWGLGNECNNLSKITNDDEAYLWTATIVNSIKSEDNTRPIMSDMHALQVLPKTGKWTLQVQGELTDIMCPHPYPSPTVSGDIEPLTGLRTTMIPTFQAELYSGITGKPALVQEIGTFSDMVGSKELVADNFRVNTLSLWANGFMGIIWWCAHEQKHHNYPPYTIGMNERELGILYEDYSPKPVGLEMKKMRDLLSSLPFDELPKKDTDAVCIITDNWGGDYMGDALASYIMAKQCGFDMTFVYANDTIPEKDIYIVPCIEGWGCMSAEAYKSLIQRAKDGASVYFSLSTGLLSDFEELFGLRSSGITRKNESTCVDFGGFTINIKNDYLLDLKETTAEVLARDENGYVIFSRNKVGKGWFYFMNCPIERNVFKTVGKLGTEPFYKVYRQLAENVISKKIVISNNQNIAVTHHTLSDDKSIVVAINYKNEPQDLDISINPSYEIERCIYGDLNKIGNCDMVIIAMRRKEL